MRSKTKTANGISATTAEESQHDDPAGAFVWDITVDPVKSFILSGWATVPNLVDNRTMSAYNSDKKIIFADHFLVAKRRCWICSRFKIGASDPEICSKYVNNFLRYLNTNK